MSYVKSAFDFHNKHLGNSHEEVHERIKSENPHYECISPKHEHSLYQYGKSSNFLNTNIYKNRPLLDDQKEHMKYLDDVTRKPTNTEHHVYSGVGFNIQNHLGKSKDNILHLKAYTSTSLNPDIADKFAYSDDMLHIHIKPGDNIHHIVNERQSKYDIQEYEAILPRNIKLKVHPEPTIHTYPNGNTVRMYHATIHSQEE